MQQAESEKGAKGSGSSQGMFQEPKRMGLPELRTKQSAWDPETPAALRTCAPWMSKEIPTGSLECFRASRAQMELGVPWGFPAGRRSARAGAQRLSKAWELRLGIQYQVPVA